jgi:predicted dehydrogenase
MRKIGVGVVGLNMGKNYALAFKNYEKSELIAVCDFNSEVLSRVSEELGVKGYLSYREMVKNPEIEAVTVVSPSYEHAPMGLYAALNGKHVLVDKPIATDLAAGDRLIKLCKEKGVTLAAVFQSRLDPMNVQMKKLVDDGALGKVFLIEGVVKWWRGDQEYYHINEEVEMWKGSWYGEGGGSLTNQGIHTLDQLCWIMGDIEYVFGQYDTVGHNIQAEDFATALIRFKNGAVGSIVCTTCAPKETQETRVSIYGTGGLVSRIGDNLTINKGGRVEKITAGDDVKSDTLHTVRGGPHDWICYDFIDSIVEDRDPVVTGESALKTVEVAKGIYQSALHSSVVKLPIPRF